jgi:hypothetical protein
VIVSGKGAGGDHEEAGLQGAARDHGAGQGVDERTGGVQAGTTRRAASRPPGGSAGPPPGRASETQRSEWTEVRIDTDLVCNSGVLFIPARRKHTHGTGEQRRRRAPTPCPLVARHWRRAPPAGVRGRRGFQGLGREATRLESDRTKTVGGEHEWTRTN